MTEPEHPQYLQKINIKNFKDYIVKIDHYGFEFTDGFNKFCLFQTHNGIIYYKNKIIDLTKYTDINNLDFFYIEKNVISKRLSFYKLTQNYNQELLKEIKHESELCNIKIKLLGFVVLENFFKKKNFLLITGDEELANYKKNLNLKINENFVNTFYFENLKQKEQFLNA